MRATSSEAYQTIEREGLLGKLQFDVYRVIFKHGPITQGEVWREHFPYRLHHSITPRFAELEKMGLIQAVGERPCRMSRMVATLWEVTENLPFKEKKPRAKSKKEIIEELKRENAALRRGLELLR